MYEKEIISFSCLCDCLHNSSYNAFVSDYITPVLDDGTFIWLISEKDCNFTNIVKWNPDTDKNEKIFIPNQDIVGIVSDGKKAYAIIYGAERWHYLFF